MTNIPLVSFKLNNSRPPLDSIRPTSIPIPSLRVEQPNPEAQSYLAASRQNFTSSAEFSRKLEKMRHLRDQTLNSLTANSSHSYDQLKDVVGLRVINKICGDVSLVFTGIENVDGGERLLRENFRSILRIKNTEGKNPLDYILDLYSSQLDAYRSMAELQTLAAAVINYQDYLQKQTSMPNLREYTLSLKEKALRDFRGLSATAKSLICWRIWQLDGNPRFEDYGFVTAEKDIRNVLRFRDIAQPENTDVSPLRDSLVILESIKNKEFQFTPTRLCTEEIRPSDDSSIVEDILITHQLEDLHALLNDPAIDNPLLVSKFNKLNPKVKDILSKLVWVLHDRPNSHEFGDRTLMQNMRLLLKIQNKNKVDVASQLLVHYKGQIQTKRMCQQMQNFFIEGGRCVNNPRALLDKFNTLLTPSMKEAIKFQIWYAHGGHSNPYFGGLDYGTKAIESNPLILYGNPNFAADYFAKLQRQIVESERQLLEAVESAGDVPDAPIDVSARVLQEKSGLIQKLPKDFCHVTVSMEYAGIASVGGLGVAVKGMAEALGSNRVIMPLYRGGSFLSGILHQRNVTGYSQGGPIPEKILSQLKETRHVILADRQRIKIFKAKLSGMRFYFVDIPHLFTVPKKFDGTTGNIYGREGGVDYYMTREACALFQKTTADLCYYLYKKHKMQQPDSEMLVHVHDAQTALIPYLLRQHHLEEWESGKTPVTVLSFHNNREPHCYTNNGTSAMLERLGLPNEETNSLIKGFEYADFVTTVSETFGKEAQMPIHDFANYMDRSVRKIAYQDKFKGIVNGNTSSENPATELQLRRWTSVLQETKGTIVPLNYGVDLDVPTFAEKIKAIQKEFCAYHNLNPEKPIVLYWGRYDSSQKGIGKLLMIMEETLKNGGQFFCVGSEPDEKAQEILKAMQKRAQELGCEDSVRIIIDSKVGGAYVHQGIWGKLARAASSFTVFPSRFEPCGLVQGEANAYGKMVVATNTGGFADTLKTEGKDANGYLFTRTPEWESPEQDEQIKKTLLVALRDAKERQHALYHGSLEEVTPHIERMKTIMRNAYASTWETTADPDQLSSARLLELCYARAFENRSEKRGTFEVDLIPNRV